MAQLSPIRARTYPAPGVSHPVFEVPSGAVDGTNRVFTVTRDYSPGTPRVWLNGLLHEVQGEDGWTETGGKTIQLDEPPRVGDSVQVYYTPIS